MPVLHLMHGDKIASHVRTTGSGIVDRQQCKHKTLLASHHVVETDTKAHNLIHS